MTIISNPVALANTISHINNPNYITGTLLEELPCDVGRISAAYKRGGKIEALEKARKELMSAAVWMLGIPIFNKIGNAVCEKVLNIPTAIDFTNALEGNNTISNSINFLTKGQLENSEVNVKHLLKYKDDFIPKQNLIQKLFKKTPKAKSNIDINTIAKTTAEKEFLTKGVIDGIDVSEIMKYGDKYINCSADTVKNLIKNVSAAKKTTSIIAVLLNCIAMGVLIPKLNQKMTQKLLDEQNKNKNSTLSLVSFDEYKNQTKTVNIQANPSFTGGSLTDTVTYRTENDNTFRLLITDIPMIIGRMITSRNKFEALEYLVMDTGSIYFYNFARGNVQKLLGKITNTPQLEAKTALQLVTDTKPEQLQKALISSKNIDLAKASKMDLNALEALTKQMFADDDGSILKSLYKTATYGKYGKINKFVKNSDLKDINIDIINMVKYLSEQTNSKDNKFDLKTLQKAVYSVNTKNAIFLTSGLVFSIIGLALLVPKLTYFISKKMSGKDGFIAIDKEENSKNKSK